MSLLLLTGPSAIAQLVPSAPEQIKQSAIARCSSGEPADLAYCRAQTEELARRERLGELMAGQREAAARLRADRDRYDLDIAVPAIIFQPPQFGPGLP